MSEKMKLIKESTQGFEALPPDARQFVLGYMTARQNKQEKK